MMKMWKRNAVVGVVLALVCVGIYLNWAYAGEKAKSLTEAIDSGKVMDDATLVIQDGLTSPDALEAGGEVQVAKDSFAQLRLSRQTSRDQAVNLLQETISYAEGENSEASNKQLEQIVNMALQESQIESMVMAKGYQDCVAYITDDAISVAVAAPEEGLQAQDVALITDVVRSQCDFGMENIRVIEVKQ